MKKKKRLAIKLSVVVLVTIGIIFFLYENDIRCVRVGHSSQFSKVQEDSIDIYYSIDTPEDTLGLFLDILRKSISANEAFWEKKMGRATVIYCHNQELYLEYGAENMPAITRLGTHIIVPSTGIDQELLSHELSHTEMFNAIDRSWLIYYQRLPNWFDEGVALQFNDSGIYSVESLADIQRWSIAQLRQIDKARDFYVNDYSELLYHYKVSKVEVEKWLQDKSKADLFLLIDEVKSGMDFYQAYQN